MAAVLGPDGFIYALGGANTSSRLSTVEAYKPGTDQWATAAGMPDARYGLVAGVATRESQHLIFTFGGVDSSFHPVDYIEAYNTSTNAWICSADDPNCTNAARALDPMPTPRAFDAAAVGSNGLIYVFDGRDSGNKKLGSLEGYDPVTNRWHRTVGNPNLYNGCDYDDLPAMSVARGGLAGAVGSDGRIYAIGGFTSSSFSPLVEAYRPGTSSRTTVAAMPTPQANLMAVGGSDGLVYAIGGGTDLDCNTVEASNPATNEWVCSIGVSSCTASKQTLTPIPTARRSMANVAGSDSRTYALGSDGGSNPLETVEAYTPAAHPTPARMAHLFVARYGEPLHFQWHMMDRGDVTGFDLFAGPHRLTARMIHPLHSRTYQHWARWAGTGTYFLRVIMTNGGDLTVLVR